MPRQKTGGRKKGVPNKIPAGLKEAILKAAELAGGDDGAVGYLTQQARMNPGPFMGLLGKVLPMQIAGDKENPLVIETVKRLLVGSDVRDQDSEDIRPATH